MPIFRSTPMTTRSRAAIVGGALLATTIAGGVAASAASAAPAVPSGCSFDQSTGISTCTTTTPTSNYTQQMNWDTVEMVAGVTTDGTPAAVLCATYAPGSHMYIETSYPLGSTVLTAHGSQVTTTTFHGVVAGNGNKPVTTTPGDSTITYTLVSGSLECQYPTPTPTHKTLVAGSEYPPVTITN